MRPAYQVSLYIARHGAPATTVPYRRDKQPTGGIKAVFPGFVSPALAGFDRPRAQRGDQWIHEVKFDGYRVQVHIANEAVKVFTRKGPRLDGAALRKSLWTLGTLYAKSAIIDGEVVVPTAEGAPDFAALQLALKSKRPFDNLVMYAFDLLYLNGF